MKRERRQVRGVAAAGRPRDAVGGEGLPLTALMRERPQPSAQGEGEFGGFLAAIPRVFTVRAGSQAGGGSGS